MYIIITCKIIIFHLSDFVTFLSGRYVPKIMCFLREYIYLYHLEFPPVWCCIAIEKQRMLKMNKFAAF